MSKIDVIIVDDEYMASDTLKKYIQDYCPELNILATANEGKEGYQLITDLKPSLVFLDIEMPKISGFEMLKMFNTVDFDIIFTTAHTGFSIKAFKYSAFDYLLKPIGVSDLKKTVNRFIQKKEQTKTALNMNTKALLNKIEKERAYEKTEIEKLIVPETTGFKMININDITYLKSDYGYTHIYCNDGSKTTSSKPLKYFNTYLEKQSSFYAIGKSKKVNLNYVSQYLNEGIIILEDETNILVPRRIRKAFLTRFQCNNN